MNNAQVTNATAYLLSVVGDNNSAIQSKQESSFSKYNT